MLVHLPSNEALYRSERFVLTRLQFDISTASLPPHSLVSLWTDPIEVVPEKRKNSTTALAPSTPASAGIMGRNDIGSGSSSGSALGLLRSSAREKLKVKEKVPPLQSLPREVVASAISLLVNR